jgi:hypothetical protein
MQTSARPIALSILAASLVTSSWFSTTYQASLDFVLPAAVRYSSFRLTVTEVGGSSVADLIELQLLGSCADA